MPPHGPGEFKPRVHVPPPVQRRPVSERMLDAAKGLGGEAERLMKYFSGEMAKMEAVQGPINTVSLWSGVVLGLLVGLILGALILGSM